MKKLIGVSLLIAFVAYYAYFRHSKFEEEKEKEEERFLAIDAYVMNDHAGNFADGFVKQKGQIPAVFRGTVVKKWLALKILPQRRFWEEALFGETIHNVAKSRSGTFLFFKKNRPLSKFFKPEEEEPETLDMPTKEFFRLYKNAEENAFVHYSQVLHKIPVRNGKRETVLWPLVHPIAPLIVNETRADDELAVRFWVRSARTKTCAHYDYR